MKEKTISEVASDGGKARWKGKSKKERVEHAKMMVDARKNKSLNKLNK